MGQLRDQELIDKVAHRIRSLRESVGVSQQAFYDETNIHIARIEAGKANVSISTLNAICRYFEISLTDFFKSIG